MKRLGVASRALEEFGNHREPARGKSSQLESAIYSFIHGLVLLYILDVLTYNRIINSINRINSQ